MKILRYGLRFTSPAFLGDADFNGRWRTPPLKALLRQWWRVAYAADHGFRVDLDTMRREEGALFGAAADDGASNRSRARFRLSGWESGKLRAWDGLEQAKVDHPEAERAGRKVGPHAYLGYGPLDGRSGTRLEKRSAAIQAGEEVQLALALVPDPRDPGRLDREYPRVLVAMGLMQHYGTVGSRSRNGWGSFALESQGDTPALLTTIAPRFTRPWRDALRLDWAHALGRSSGDGEPLIWTTQPFTDWKAAMRGLAVVKIGLRLRFPFPPNEAAPHASPADRHWLAYPVTHHAVRDWGQNARLPNTLRFKLRPTSDGKVVGVVFHMPCCPPAQPFRPQMAKLEAVWQAVHQHLDDKANGLQRAAA